MIRSELEVSAWAKRLKAECPTSYKDAIDVALSVRAVVIEKRDDYSARADFVWAIIPDDQTDFWLHALPTRKAAIDVCQNMRWTIRR